LSIFITPVLALIVLLITGPSRRVEVEDHRPQSN
jgi:hypothetical protein